MQFPLGQLCKTKLISSLCSCSWEGIRGDSDEHPFLVTCTICKWSTDSLAMEDTVIIEAVSLLQTTAQHEWHVL